MARVRLTAVASVLLLLAASVSAQSFLMPASVYSAGGLPGASATYRLNGSVAQSVQGTGISSGYKGYWGFWYGLSRPGNVGVVQILSPAAIVDTGDNVIPVVKFHNYSSLDKASFATQVKLVSPTLGVVYDSAIGVSQLGPGRDTTLTFPAYNVGADTGVWLLNAYARLPGDTHPENDSLGMQFKVTARPPWPAGWREVASAPGLVKDGGWLAYDGSGGPIYAARGYKAGDFFSYDPLGDSDGVWATLTAIPLGVEGKPPYKGANGVVVGDYVYATKGNNTVGFWRYSIDSLNWVQMADVPYGPSGKKVKGGTDMVYVTVRDTGWIYLLKGYKQDFFRYNTVTGAWDTNLPLAPAGIKPKWDKGSWLVDAGSGTFYAHKAKYQELWTFDLATHTWGTAALSGMPLVGMMGKSKKSKDGGCGVYDGGSLYALKGGNTQEFWKFNISGAAWTELETMPAVGSTLKKKRVKGGGDMAAYGGGVFFAFKGNKTSELWRYVAASVAEGRPGREGVMASPTDLGRVGVAIAPNPVTNGRALLRYGLPAAGPARLRVYDITGRNVMSVSLVAGRSGQAGLDLRELSAGVYLVKFEATGYQSTQKLVIESPASTDSARGGRHGRPCPSYRPHRTEIDAGDGASILAPIRAAANSRSGGSRGVAMGA